MKELQHITKDLLDSIQDPILRYETRKAYFDWRKKTKIKERGYIRYYDCDKKLGFIFQRAGICYFCAEHRPTVPNQIMCVICRKRKRDINRKSRQKKKMKLNIMSKK